KAEDAQVDRDATAGQNPHADRVQREDRRKHENRRRLADERAQRAIFDEGKKRVQCNPDFVFSPRPRTRYRYAARANSSSTDFSNAIAFCTLGRCCKRAKCAAQFVKPDGSTSSCVPRRTHQKKCASAAVK